MRQEAELEETEGVFDLVTDEEYARLVQSRQQEAWICDDGELSDQSCSSGVVCEGVCLR